MQKNKTLASWGTKSASKKVRSKDKRQLRKSNRSTEDLNNIKKKKDWPIALSPRKSNSKKKNTGTDLPSPKFCPTSVPTTTLSVNPSVPNAHNLGEDVFMANISMKDFSLGDGKIGEMVDNFPVLITIPGPSQAKLQCDSLFTVQQFLKRAQMKTKNMLSSTTQDFNLYTTYGDKLQEEDLVVDNEYVVSKIKLLDFENNPVKLIMASSEDAPSLFESKPPQAVRKHKKFSYMKGWETEEKTDAGKVVVYHISKDQEQAFHKERAESSETIGDEDNHRQNGRHDSGTPNELSRDWTTETETYTTETERTEESEVQTDEGGTEISEETDEEEATDETELRTDEEAEESGAEDAESETEAHQTLHEDVQTQHLSDEAALETETEVQASEDTGEGVKTEEVTEDNRKGKEEEDSADTDQEEELSGEIIRDFEYEVQFVLGGSSCILNFRGNDTLAYIKETLAKSNALNNFGVSKMDKYSFVLPHRMSSPIEDESRSLDTIPYAEVCRKSGTCVQLHLVLKKHILTKDEKRENKEIGAMVGRPLCWSNQEDETTYFRRMATWLFLESKLKKIRSSSTAVVSSTRQMTRVLDEPLDESLVPSHLFFWVLLSKCGSKKTFEVKDGGRETASEFYDRMITSIASVGNGVYEKGYTEDGKPKFVLKVQGRGEYVTGDIPLIDFAYIRECVVKDTRPLLVLVDQNIGTHIHPGKHEENLMSRKVDFEEIADEIKYNHGEICFSEAMSWKHKTHISVWELSMKFHIRILGVEHLNWRQSECWSAAVDAGMSVHKVGVFCSVGVYHGGFLLFSEAFTSLAAPSTNPRWFEDIVFMLPISSIPREARLCFTLWARPHKREAQTKVVKELRDSDIPLAWINFNIFDYKSELKTSTQCLIMWPDGPANPIGTCIQNVTSPNSTRLIFEMDQYTLPVVFPTEPLGKEHIQTNALDKIQTETYLDEQYIDQLLEILAKDSIHVLTNLEKSVVWGLRGYCLGKPNALAKFIESVNYTDYCQVQEMHSLLDQWNLPSPVDALELLDSRFADAKVRAFAVSCLENMPTEDFMDFLLQLVQVLKYEPYHDSALARFLLQRAWKNPFVGHRFFWYLRAEVHVPEISERFGLLLEAYLRGCGEHRTDLKKQCNVQKDLIIIAESIKDEKIKDESKLEMVQNGLKNLNVPDNLHLPLNPSYQVNGILYEKCKFMDSKKLPLWVVWQNSDPVGAPIYTIFKAGDDLRQDMLTLQMIRIMDKLWKKEGLDLKLSPYGCIATGDEIGFIEIVLNSTTTANISQKFYGASASYKEVVKHCPIKDWLMIHNPTKHMWQQAVNNFVLSCAGYCVATYVLGIGDRHNDNVMVTEDGRLFHIDFGHFLGNIKKFMGLKRERTPFVFTPGFAQVMGGRDSPDFKRFVDTCISAYRILRKHATTFINLFAMMLSTGIPELKTLDDIKYLRQAFALNLTDEQADQRFTELIYIALECWTTILNNVVHLAAHSSSKKEKDKKKKISVRKRFVRKGEKKQSQG